MYILFVIMFSYTVNGVSVGMHTVEFNNEKQCQYAAQVTRKQHYVHSAYCLRKD